MCGRINDVKPLVDIEALFGGRATPLATERWKARYNVAPGDDVPIGLVRGQARQIGFARWGWDTGTRRSFCARADQLRNPYWGSRLRAHRCTVFASGFYEWASKQQPFHFSRVDRQPLMFAGLWYPAHLFAQGRKERQFVIITTSPNDDLDGVHDRMPAILEARDIDTWMNGDVSSALALLAPSRQGTLERYPVTTYVNSTSNEGPECLSPVSRN